MKHNLELLPDGYEISHIDEILYEKCKLDEFSCDFVSTYDNLEHFMKYGRGFVILEDGNIVAGASSYSSYLGGIEIEVDTRKDERRKHLALVACSALILDCLKEGIYPSWNAANLMSVSLAKKLGYIQSHEYLAYEINQ